MKWFLYNIFCLWTQVLSKKLFTKVFGTPIYDLNQICVQHHMVLLKETPFDPHQQEYTDIYAIDFSPTNDITDWKNVLQILLGKTITGKIRLVYFDHITNEALFRDPLHKQPNVPLEAIQYLDNDLYNTIVQWEPKFQIYLRNCQHFARYVVR